MASGDASPIPVKNQAYRVSFPLLDADGDLVTGATGLDSEVSKDGGTFTDCTSEATEIATASGMYYLDLTATEMNADTVCVIVKTTSSGAKTTPMVLYPNKTGGLSVNVTSWAGTATTTGDIALKTTLAKTTHITGFNDLSAAQVNTEADTALVDVGLTTTVTGRIDAAVSTRATPAQVQTELGTYGAVKPTTAGRTLDISTGGEAGIDWANVGAPTTAQNLSGTTISTSQAVASVSGAVGSVTGAVASVTNPVALTAAYDAAKTAATQTSVNTIDDFVDTEVSAIKVVTDKLDTALELDGAVYRYTTNALEQAPVGGGGGGDASQATLLAVKAKTDNLPVDPADASDIAASFATVNTKLDTIDDFVDTEVAAIKAKTDQLTFTGGRVDANVADVTLDVGDLNSIADAILKRDFTAISGEAAYSLLNAARMLRNSWNSATGTLIVKKEDGTTTAWTRPLTTDPAAQPIVGAT
jgi:hypothetical protein